MQTWFDSLDGGSVNKEVAEKIKSESSFISKELQDYYAKE